MKLSIFQKTEDPCYLCMVTDVEKFDTIQVTFSYKSQFGHMPVSFQSLLDIQEFPFKYRYDSAASVNIHFSIKIANDFSVEFCHVLHNIMPQKVISLQPRLSKLSTISS